MKYRLASYYLSRQTTPNQASQLGVNLIIERYLQTNARYNPYQRCPRGCVRTCQAPEDCSNI